MRSRARKYYILGIIWVLDLGSGSVVTESRETEKVSRSEIVSFFSQACIHVCDYVEKNVMLDIRRNTKSTSPEIILITRTRARVCFQSVAAKVWFFTSRPSNLHRILRKKNFYKKSLNLQNLFLFSKWLKILTFFFCAHLCSKLLRSISLDVHGNSQTSSFFFHSPSGIELLIIKQYFNIWKSETKLWTEL